MSAPHSESCDTAAAEAADWYARLRAPDVSEIEALRFRAWLTGDPARRREFYAIDAFWTDIAAIEHSPEVKRVRESIAARQRKRWWRASRAIAATLVVAVVSGWLAWQHWGASHYVTGVGEQRMVPLADGSIVTLNTSTEIRLHYSDTERNIELVRGQANFDVAKDSRRPFIVAAGGGRVRAVGTVFDVYKSGDKVIVTLIEGKLVVTPNQPSRSDEPVKRVDRGDERSGTVMPVHSATHAAPSDIRLTAGEQLSFPAVARLVEAPGVIKLVPADIPRVSAWRTQKLDFSNTLLPDAIAEVNRYSREQVMLDDPELIDARMSGTF
ncbi:MAG: FecR domain-containing protein, partial [Gammaproteobacteria bacterium]